MGCAVLGVIELSTVVLWSRVWGAVVVPWSDQAIHAQ